MTLDLNRYKREVLRRSDSLQTEWTMAGALPVPDRSERQSFKVGLLRTCGRWNWAARCGFTKYVPKSWFSGVETQVDWGWAVGLQNRGLQVRVLSLLQIEKART
jgi:hypothetical protein